MQVQESNQAVQTLADVASNQQQDLTALTAHMGSNMDMGQQDAQPHQFAIDQNGQLVLAQNGQLGGKYLFPKCLSCTNRNILILGYVKIKIQQILILGITTD